MKQWQQRPPRLRMTRDDLLGVGS